MSNRKHKCLDCDAKISIVMARCSACRFEFDKKRGKDPNSNPQNPTEEAIEAECLALRDMLINKNRAYGDSALDPVRVFSKASSVEQILVRLDDKLSRLARGAAAGEDVVLDLMGYLVLLRVAMKRGKK